MFQFRLTSAALSSTLPSSSNVSKAHSVFSLYTSLHCIHSMDVDKGMLHTAMSRRVIACRSAGCLIQTFSRRRLHESRCDRSMIFGFSSFLCLSICISVSRKLGLVLVRRLSPLLMTTGLVCPPLIWTRSNSLTSPFWLCWGRGASERSVQS